MREIFCPIHNEIIKIYENSEEENFVDNNEKNTVIFTDAIGQKYLKRFIDGGCDYDCQTVKEILNS